MMVPTPGGLRQPVSGLQHWHLGFHHPHSDLAPRPRGIHLPQLLRLEEQKEQAVRAAANYEPREGLIKAQSWGKLVAT